MTKRRENKDRWDKYCIEYVKDFNRARAYKAAKYQTSSDESARNAATRLMCKNVYVQDKIKDLLAKQEKTAVKTAAEIIEELENIGFEGKKDSDKIRALELLGKRYKLFPTNISGDLDVTVTNLADIAALMRGK